MDSGTRRTKGVGGKVSVLRRGILGASVLLTLVVGVSAADAQRTEIGSSARTAISSSDTVGSAEQQLAERYVPQLRLGVHERCGSTGEPFWPIPVDAVLGNDQVLLRQLGESNPVVVRGPAASDLYGLGEGFFLDFPGSALDPGCIYELDNERYAQDLPPTVYAHVIENAGDGQLVVQYWFYWYFNDWNNKHESDWEGIALLFPVPTIDEALTVDPVRVGYAQHEGGEWAAWDDAKLTRVGQRPVVYSSHTSHASYFDNALYLGRNAGEGFGCDDTSGDVRTVDPEVVVLPPTVDDPDDPLAWVEYLGRWGERGSGAFNGPTGPAAKDRWTDPISWFDELRPASVEIPAIDGAGRGVVGSFCTAVEAGSDVLVTTTTSPARVLVVLGLLVAMLWLAIRSTDWSLVRPLPIVARRRWGQIVRSSIRIYRQRWAQFAILGLAYLGVMLVTIGVMWIIRFLPFVGTLFDAMGDRSGFGVMTAFTASAVPSLIAYVLVEAASAHLLQGLEIDEERSWADACRAVAAQWRDLLIATVRATLVVVGLGITVVGLPWAIRQYVRYQFAPQAIMVERRSGRDALARSTALVRTRWWHTALVLSAVHGAVALLALLVGLLALVLATGLPLWVLTVVQVLVLGLLIPVVSIVVALLYGDAVAEYPERTDEDSPAEPVVVAGASRI